MKLALIFGFLGFFSFCVAGADVARGLVAKGEYKNAYELLDKSCKNKDLESCGELAGLFTWAQAWQKMMLNQQSF